jgi:mannose-1-phosphate guanylyltransferase
MLLAKEGDSMGTRGGTWVVVLAGGSGNRLATLTRGNDGVVVPKQFCRFGSPVTMLERTLERARAIVPRMRTVVAVIDEHRRWWQQQLATLPVENVVVQSLNQGTGAAVLQAVMTVLNRDPDATLLVLPSDHGIEDECVLHKSMSTLVNEARNSPEHLVLLGAEPTSAETSYGWIVRGPERFGRTSAVSRFVEKPVASEAQALLLEGALWNTFIFAGTVHALALLYAACRPEWLRRAFAETSGVMDDRRHAYGLSTDLPPLDFSRHLLGAATDWLRVLALPPCGWTDLGTPERMQSWMKQRLLGPRETADRADPNCPRIQFKRKSRGAHAIVMRDKSGQGTGSTSRD